MSDRDIVTTLTPPYFTHRGPPYCGPELARYLLEIKRLKFKHPHPKRWVFFNPTLSGVHKYLGLFDTMVAYLRYNEGKPSIHQVFGRNKRVKWLKEQLNNNRAVALFVWSKWWCPLPHWVVVAGMKGEQFLVYDDRVGETSHDHELPIGNTVWESERLTSVWKGFFYGFSTAISLD